MSRILRHRKLVILAIVIFLSELMKVFIFPSRKIVYVLLVFDIIMMSLLILDIKVLCSISDQFKPFGARSRVRNVDFLIIGEAVNPALLMPDYCNSFVQIKLPGISEEIAYQIVRRTHSILKNGGSILIVLKKRNADKKNFRMIDTFFLHDLTIREKKLDRLFRYRKFVLLFNPITCFRMLAIKAESGFGEIGGGSTLTAFCEERGYSVHILMK